MTNRPGLTPFTGLLAVTVLFAVCPPSVAQERAAAGSDFSAQQQQKGQQQRAAPAPRAAPQRAAPQRAAPQRAAPQRAAPRVAAPRRTTPVVRQPQTAPRVVRQPKSTPRIVRQPKATGPKVAAPVRAPRVVTPRSTKVIATARLRGLPARGAGRTVIGGHRYSVWRRGHRIRYGNGWRTFVALSLLSAIAIGANEYYPYAYISAPEPYCEGLTADGCHLMWQEVDTVEGGVINQCVAYCPWR